MSVRDMEALFRPRGVAVAAEGDGPLTGTLIRNLTASGAGVPVTRTIPPAAPCDLWVAAVAPAAQPALIAQAGANGARVVLLVGAHTPDGGDDARHHAAIRDAARAAGVRVVGPDSLGIALPAAGRRLVAGAFHRPPRAGRVALVSQSGTLAGSILDWAARRDVGFSHVAVLGGMADVGPDEVLNTLAMQGDCHAVLLALDRIGDARRFMSAARAASRLKPVIVLHTPTGDATTPEPVIDAAFRRAGLLRAGTLESLFDALEILDVAPALTGNRLAIVANGRGVGALAARALATAGGRLAHPAAGGNPLDLGEGADGAAYAAALARLRADPGVDGVLLLHAPTVESDAAAVARAVAGACAGPGHPVLTSWLGDRDAERVLPDLARRQVPAFDTPDRAVRAFCQGAAWRTVQALLAETPPAASPGPAPDRGGALAVIGAAGARTALTAAEAGDLCRCYGLPAAGAEGTGLTVRLDTDPLFGPVISVHAGTDGAAVSVLPPLNATLARETLMRVAGVALPDPALTAPLAGVLVRVAHMAADLERLESLALSPAGAMATLVPPGRERTPFAIQPYPAALEQALALPDGRRLLVRPVRPEDEPGLQALFRRLTPQEIRLRFFAPKQELTHSVAARMTQIDYQREMGLVVTDAGDGGTIHGAVHLSGDGDGERAEFAIMVAHDMAGLGLGPLLMRRIIDHGRSRGLRAIIGEVLAENRPMLRLCEVLGFTRRATPDDPGVIHVTLTL
ncbi:acyl-CoA synthetase (NDP forming)/RimJ/RimL family protein N-acetyltransferase [Azospirillum fermentarium]|uniref:bifunctional acetate--CoA ligase family protein/GNAT family N-acetyltransferase n=1 Tax=Azospirillum fermentarium TaxID=1233114 RepID=UPI0022261FC3|nr:GNAT family N-acetyltransferase [Azospirillum fermentarium]MCW2247214.1 acyl-CoA synthetase (NDP forming)/RimJ/RimL family protein N-acetyltransferase [Azospirillum fermentarium]